MTRKTLQKLLIILMLSLPVGACGVKPNSVSAPEGADPTQYPRTYPSPARD